MEGTMSGEYEDQFESVIKLLRQILEEIKELRKDIRVEAAPQSSADGFRLPDSGIRLDEEVKAFERRSVETALKEAKGVKVEAARLLGVNKDKMRYLCRKHGI
jgi:transcriptional regulator with GAF, ATPase, and Fis domain